MLLRGISLFLTVNLVNCQYLKPITPAIEDFDLNTNHSIIFAVDYLVKSIYDYVSVDASNAPVAMFGVTYAEMCLFDSLALTIQK